MSGVYMDIISAIKNLLSSNGVQTLLPIFNLLKENSFDIKRVLNNLTPETLAPVLKMLAENNANKPVSVFNNDSAVGVTPIANVADKDIVYALNRYLNSDI